MAKYFSNPAAASRRSYAGVAYRPPASVLLSLIVVFLVFAAGIYVLGFYLR